jgi:dUTP pyrophosphatase
METLKVKRLDPEAKLPSRAYAGDAGLDLYSVEDVALEPGGRHAIRTGIAIEIPFGCVGLVHDKSGLALRHGLKTVGNVIDAGFRGELRISVANLGGEKLVIAKGQKIAQLLIQKVELLEVVEVEDLDATSRGDGNFGSTGKF